MVVDQGRKLKGQTHAGYRGHENAGMGLQLNEIFQSEHSCDLRRLNDNLYSPQVNDRSEC